MQMEDKFLHNGGKELIKLYWRKMVRRPGIFLRGAFVLIGQGWRADRVIFSRVFSQECRGPRRNPRIP
tara:strand:- start:23 stop:226 length:204 start_codon:yes stop_codon:yes gene_type:complete